MAKGGARPGAGRKKGSLNRKTTEVANRLIESGGITPLEVMLEAMRDHYENKRLDEAAAIAKDAAPYIHPRLSSVEYKQKERDLDALTDAELEAIIRGRQVGPKDDKPPVVH